MQLASFSPEKTLYSRMIKMDSSKRNMDSSLLWLLPKNIPPTDSTYVVIMSIWFQEMFSCLKR